MLDEEAHLSPKVWKSSLTHDFFSAANGANSRADGLRSACESLLWGS